MRKAARSNYGKWSDEHTHKRRTTYHFPGMPPLGFFKIRIAGQPDQLAFGHESFGTSWPIKNGVFECGGLRYEYDNTPLVIWEKPKPVTAW